VIQVFPETWAQNDYNDYNSNAAAKLITTVIKGLIYAIICITFSTVNLYICGACTKNLKSVCRCG